MTKRLQGVLAFLLVFVLFIGMIPPMSVEAATTTGNILLFDYAGYTTTLSSQLAITYRPNGTGTATTAYLKNLGWHFARYNNVPYHDDPIYCIEPNKSFGASTSYNYMDTGVTVNGSGTSNGANAWYSMPASYRKAITLILLYSRQMWDSGVSVTTTARDDNPNVPLRIATQFLIYEIVCGLRNPTTFESYSSNGYTNGDEFYLAGEEIGWFVPNYNAIVENVQAALKLPSFVGSTSSNAPIITLEDTLTTVTDTNGVLSSFTFPSGSGASFTQYGNTLYIEQMGGISNSDIFSCYRSVPSAENSTVTLYYGGAATYQTCVKLHNPASSNLYGYFRLNAPEPEPDPTGSLNITKNTSNGQNRSGWMFNIYYDSACTSVLTSSLTTPSSGKLSISGIPIGTYYVKEMGNTSASIAAMYSCTSSNPQKVTVTSGGTASVTFTNTAVQTTGSLNISKATSDGANRSGWQFSIYSDLACTSLLSGPHTTNSSGAVSVSNLPAGTVYVKEIGNANSSVAASYTCSTTNPQAVTITAGGTASVSFTNTLIPSAPETTGEGELEIRKNLNSGYDAGGWQFSLYHDPACTQLALGPLTSLNLHQYGYLSRSEIPVGTYYVKEHGNKDPELSAKYTCVSPNPQVVTIRDGETSSLVFDNVYNFGDLKIIKDTGANGKADLSGWQFNLYRDAACTDLISGPHRTYADGIGIIDDVPVGTVYVKEIGHEDAETEDEYTCVSVNPQPVTITSGETSEVTFVNEQKPGWIVIRKRILNDRDLAGWKFGLYEDAECTKLLYGPYITDSTGYTTTDKIPPWTHYYVKEIGHVDPKIEAMYECTTSRVIRTQILPNNEQTMSYTNVLQPGELFIKKTTSDGNNLAGWQFFIYRDADCTQEIGGPYVTNTTGMVSAGLFGWDVVYVKEAGHQDSKVAAQYVCTSINPQTAIINHNGTSTVSFYNTLNLGKIEFHKTTNTGNHLGGWTFRVSDSDGNTMGEYTTNESGYAITGDLPAGRYYVQELYPEGDEYWQVTLGGHDVTVEAGKTTVDAWHNVELGLVQFQKTTNTGDSLVGWEITIYSDADCTQEIYTLTTNEDGKAGYYLYPGTYWAKETGDTQGRFDSTYWQIDQRVQKFEIKPHEDVAIEFTNVQSGNLKIIKTMDDGGSLEGWQFKITDSDGTEIPGSPFTTAADGTVLVGKLPSGKYTVEEILPENSPYICKSDNPQKVTVVPGQTAEVSFTNAMASGKITVSKIDISRKPLAGAKFLLEWSEDGAIWWPITYSEKEVATKGGCSNPNVVDGCLVSGEDGLLEWDNLLPGLRYRVTELEAPEGYVLLEDYAYEGELPQDDLTVDLYVINCHGFTLPATGSHSMWLVQILAILAALGLVILSIRKIRRKELR